MVVEVEIDILCRQCRGYCVKDLWEYLAQQFYRGNERNLNTKMKMQYLQPGCLRCKLRIVGGNILQHCCSITLPQCPGQGFTERDIAAMVQDVVDHFNCESKSNGI